LFHQGVYLQPNHQAVHHVEHIDTASYAAARSGVAVRERTSGLFKHPGSFRTNAGVYIPATDVGRGRSIAILEIDSFIEKPAVWASRKSPADLPSLPTSVEYRF
jgi:hypothetical protein